MVMENLTNGVLLEALPEKISSLIILFQAIGGLIICYIIFSVVNMLINKKKYKEVKKINKNLEEIKKLLRKKRTGK